MRLFPDHLEGVAKRLDSNNGVFPFPCDDGMPAYQLHCTCGREELEVWKSNMPTVYARCIKCHSVIIAYDLRLYPAASYIVRPDPFTLVRLSCGCDTLRLYVAFEYSEPEPDVPFDPNDISWCYIRCTCQRHQSLEEIVNDETA